MHAIFSHLSIETSLKALFVYIYVRNTWRPTQMPRLQSFVPNSLVTCIHKRNVAAEINNYSNELGLCFFSPMVCRWQNSTDIRFRIIDDSGACFIHQLYGFFLLLLWSVLLNLYTIYMCSINRRLIITDAMLWNDFVYFDTPTEIINFLFSIAFIGAIYFRPQNQTINCIETRNSIPLCHDIIELFIEYFRRK